MSTEYEDIRLTCVDCGGEFTHTVRDQIFYAEKGYVNTPKRCRQCRESRKMEGESATAKFPPGEKEYFTAKCATCGGEAKVPFKPTEGRPVYCYPCHSARVAEGLR